MKKTMLGVVVGVLIATAVGAYQAENKKGDSSSGGMMPGMKGMMGEQSPEMMQRMKEMMARMSKMMDMCSHMMGNSSQPKKDESAK